LQRKILGDHLEFAMQQNHAIDQTVGGVARPTVTAADVIASTAMGEVALRVYRADGSPRQSPVVLHLHGGSFVAGTVESGQTAATLLAEAGAIVASVDYPLAPKHPFPEALTTAFNVLIWLAGGRAPFAGKKPSLYVAGEEAGGNIAAALALMAHDQKTPTLIGQILLSPMVDPCMATRSVREAKAGPAGCQWADGWHQYLRTPDKAQHPYASPIGSSRLAGVAPALLVTASDDLLRDETLTYARRLRESGVAVRQQVLTAPTGWPCALYYGADRNAAWAGELRESFASFFADTMPGVSVSQSHHRIRA
jgi:acetyl esterase/lipase